MWNAVLSEKADLWGSNICAPIWVKTFCLTHKTPAACEWNLQTLHLRAENIFPPQSRLFPPPPFLSYRCTSSSHFTTVFLLRTSPLPQLSSFISVICPLPVYSSSTLTLHDSLLPASGPSLLTVTGNFASLPFCGGDKGDRCPLAGYVTGCHMRRTLWDGPALSAVTTQITSTASHLISTSNSISGN